MLHNSELENQAINGQAAINQSINRLSQSISNTPSLMNHHQIGSHHVLLNSGGQLLAGHQLISAAGRHQQLINQTLSVGHHFMNESMLSGHHTAMMQQQQQAASPAAYRSTILAWNQEPSHI